MKNHPETLSTGFPVLDAALGTGGIPRGQLVEIYGEESSGKSTLALQMVAEAQRRGWKAGYLDLDHTFTPSYARRCGVSLPDALIAAPVIGEDALGMTYRLLSSGEIDLVILDPIAALVPRREYETGANKPASGEINRLLNTRLRCLARACQQSRAVLVILNQIRFRFQSRLASRLTTPGGLSLKLLSSLRVELIRGVKLTQGEKTIGESITARITKNSFSRRVSSTILLMVYNRGMIECSSSLRHKINNISIRKQRSRFWYREPCSGHNQKE